ncbi:hypothetical protein ACHAXT_012115 [Thalassiosira profunda]
MPPLPPRARVRRRRAPSVAAGASSLALLAASSAPSARASYLGPAPCASPSFAHIKGYAAFNHLLFDMASVAATFKSGRTVPEDRLTFRICPGTVIDLDDSSLPLGYLPVEVPRVTLQCGERGNRGSDPNGSDTCTIRGGGKRDPDFRTWNADPQRAYKTSAAGIVGGGEGSVAQIYVHGESAYEIALRGLTFDNSPSRQETELYEEYVAQFGENFQNDDGHDASGEIEAEYEESVPSASSGNNGYQIQENRDGVRNLQSGTVKPAHRFASVAVRGKGYGDDAGPRLLTIENCRFERHRGYAVLVSPGILRPDVPGAPEYKKTSSVNAQSSGSIYGHGGSDGSQSPEATQSYNDRRGRRLNLLDDGNAYIPEGGPIRYYDDAADSNYRDGRRVKIANTEFVDNVVSGDTVAGLVTSAYSLTLTGCKFENNDAKAMVFVYNTDALIDNSVFAHNAVEVSTVVLASPEDAKTQTASSFGEQIAPTHIVERSCFLSSKVGMSNVLVTDIDAAGFGQRDNHASGTEFSWVSSCEGAAAEGAGHDCVENGNCDGTCVAFDTGKCEADGANGREYEMMWNGGGASDARGVWGLGMTVGLALVLGLGMIF